MAEQEEKKSPIKNLPVRLPGQSLDEEIQAYLDDKVSQYALMGVIAIVLALLEWYRYFAKQPPMPVFYTFIAIIVSIYCFFKLKNARLVLRQMKLGRLGERAVGQFLEEKLRPIRCQVLHDIPADGFNVDHVIIGPTGIFSVETKTHSKPAKGESSVKYDGQHVTVNGFAPDRDPVVQAKAEARWLSELLEASTGKKFPVKPIVLYPGWFVDKMPEGVDVWVLNEKALPVFIQNHRSNLPPDDINLVTFHLKRYVIARTNEETAKK